MSGISAFLMKITELSLHLYHMFCVVQSFIQQNSWTNNWVLHRHRWPTLRKCLVFTARMKLCSRLLKLSKSARNWETIQLSRALDLTSKPRSPSLMLAMSLSPFHSRMKRICKLISQWFIGTPRLPLWWKWLLSCLIHQFVRSFTNVSQSLVCPLLHLNSLQLTVLDRPSHHLTNILERCS